MANELGGRGFDETLHRLGAAIEWPAEPDLASAVGERLRAEMPAVPVRGAHRVPRRVFRPIRTGRPAWQLAVAAAVAAVVLFSTVLAFSPGARKAVAGWFGLRGVEIKQTPEPPRAPIRRLGEGLDLGRQASIQEAERVVGFRVRTPGALGSPDAVFVPTLSSVPNQVFLLYGPRRGLPETATTGVGALLSEFRGGFDRAFLEKAAAATQTSFVRVNGSPGFWIQGMHEVIYLDEDGNPIRDTFRLAGSVLLWEEDGVTFRLESALTLDQALAIARTLS